MKSDGIARIDKKKLVYDSVRHSATQCYILEKIKALNRISDAIEVLAAAIAMRKGYSK